MIKNFRWILFVLANCFTIHAAIASDSPYLFSSGDKFSSQRSDSSVFNNMYLGASANMNFTSIDANMVANHFFGDPGDPNVITNALSGNTTDSNLSGSIFFGLSHTFKNAYNQFFLAGEFFNNFQQQKETLTDTETATTIFDGEVSQLQDTWNFSAQVMNEFGFRILPGIVLNNNVALFGIVGVSTAIVKQTSNVSSTITVGPDSNPFGDFNLQNTSRKTAYSFGGGMNWYLSKLALRISYIYTNYGKINFSQEETAQIFGEFITGLSVNGQSKITNNTVNLGVFFWI